ncbi:hypothetical protein CB0940_00718 [Cercospora beticola]|uniref:Heterokaryon incompatibility domain-containing protein n=1 Tax=Cercospora beticola TaxID=122368 RepID=A0A2G5I8E7_CERBT|nr:hypothetical protein CB0940_00718 [Cercospora beticola]PIB01049.1 hypothetical protein CB0940_00718 [Cercospora beticola]WPA96145.1 hypothetical protein RHO25_000751 [Cercospora beticola]CAK1355566.1 unnamed protein product [Cercospora beticola]
MNTVEQASTIDRLRDYYDLTLFRDRKMCELGKISVARQSKEYGKRIPFSDLPKTFQDAVTVVRKLGLTHLWIDALCIVQDDEASLSKEISRMNEVYAGSTFTVALANAPETDAGFLGTRWPLSWQDCWLTEEGNVNIVAHADAGQQHSAMPGFCPLDKRGWVVQERLLSPRTIYYGKEHIFWDCRQTSDHEQQPFEGSNAYGGAQKEEDKKFNIREHDVLLDNGMTGKLKRCYSKLQMLDVDGRDLMWESILRTTWHLIVSAYTNSTLSLDQDKSRALAGAGALIQKKFSMKASFGLWHDFFLTDLLWFPLRAEGPHPDPELFDRAPSWSWMARNRAVYNPWIVDMASRAMFDGRYAYLIDAQLKAELITLPEPTEFSVALGQIHDFGPYATRLRGPLLKVKWGQDMTERPDEWRHDNGYFVTTDRKLALERESDHEHEHRNFRADYILPADLDLFCLLVTETRNEAKGMIDKQLGLILEKMDGPDRYRRVGALQHALSDRACEACALFPDDAPIAEVDII